MNERLAEQKALQWKEGMEAESCRCILSYQGPGISLPSVQERDARTSLA